MNIEVIRRIAERGLKHAQREEDSIYCDLFQHMLDEIEQAKLYHNSETIRAFRKFAVKVKNPELKGQDTPSVFHNICIEIAEELEVEAILDNSYTADFGKRNSPL